MVENTDNTIGMTVSSTTVETRRSFVPRDPARIRALQLTDLHLFAQPEQPELDAKTLADIVQLVELTDPDLLMITGDLWHENPNGQGREYMAYAIGQIERLGTPWLFVWGNHDRLDDYAHGHDVLACASNSLYCGGRGAGNYSVEARDANGESIWKFLCLNSSDRGLMEPQRAWLRALASRQPADKSTPPIFVLCHIPVQQYQMVWERNQASGIRLEAVCSWAEDGSSLALLQEQGPLRAYLCGHDHINDYGGVVDGVELIYGRATGTAGYGADSLSKGGKLVTIDAYSGHYTWESWCPDGSRWRPIPGTRIVSQVRD